MNVDSRSGGVVVHLDEEGDTKQTSVMRNVSNLLDDLDGDTEVELVAHGPGIGLCLSDSPQAATLQGLIRRGVTVAACENTLRAQNIDRNRLAGGVVPVPAGMGELVRKQRHGWAYVRP
jgi:intracellular sulfur oxidation DsrE/DsrF family protein